MEENLMMEAEAAAGQPESDAARVYSQAEVDAMIERRLAEAEAAQAARLEAARAEGRSEAERLGRMTAAERLQHERAQVEQAAREREAALNAREAEIRRRELRAEAAGQLAERQLPGELVELVDCADAEAMGRSVERLEAVFRKAVQDGVDQRLRSSGVRPGLGQRQSAGDVDDATYYSMMNR